MWTRDFWRATAERVIRAFAVGFLGILGGEKTLDLRGVDWKADLAIAGGIAFLNLLVCLAAGAGIGPKGSPSLVRDPAAADPPPGEHRVDPSNVHRVEQERMMIREADRDALRRDLRDRPL